MAVTSCGQASRSTPELSASGASASVVAAGGTQNAAGQGGGPADAAGAPDFSVDIDVSDCAERAVSDCSGVEALYDSNGGFKQTPAFAACQMFNSFDGCGKLQFAFDAEGCAVSVSPGPRGWKYSQHLLGLEACLAETLKGARFPCLASGTLRYEESCFVR